MKYRYAVQMNMYFFYFERKSIFNIPDSTTEGYTVSFLFTPMDFQRMSSFIMYLKRED